MSFEQSELDINFLSLVVALSNFTYKVGTACLIGSSTCFTYKVGTACLIGSSTCYLTYS